MSRLIVVSNRVADLERGAQAGGLATALVDLLSKNNCLWFGWDGEIVEDGASTGLELSRRAATSTATQPLTRSEYRGYYLGFSNTSIWPICHYRMDLANFNAEHAARYFAVNRRFAGTLAALIDPSDLVWVHDYHLIPLGAALRENGVKNKIGFFLHIPFPAPEVFAALPDHENLIRTLLEYDLIGFQTEHDLANFSAYVAAYLAGVREQNGVVRVGAASATARSFPIGIDVDAFRAMAVTEEADRRIASLQRSIFRTYIVGVDRLDYSKGLPDRFRAFRHFLETYPERRKTAVLMQVAPPTREELQAYAEIRSELEQLSGTINGQLGDFDWMPVRYIHRALPRETLAALFRGSKVGLVTPLRDGMNLVAKEYVAAQDPDDPGVLILSQFAGAAEDLKEALIVNPYDVEEMALSLERAFAMPQEERIKRHGALLERVRARSNKAWGDSFLEALKLTEDSGGNTAGATQK